MPLELWVRAVQLGLRIVELPVPLIYLDEKRSFGGAVDHADTRLAVYRQVLDRAESAMTGKKESIDCQRNSFVTTPRDCGRGVNRRILPRDRSRGAFPNATLFF